MLRALARGGALQIDLDDFRRAGPDEKQQLDLGAALQEASDDAIELVVDVGNARQIAFVENRGRETRLGEDHHAGGGLDQMRAGSRTDDEKEGVLDLSMQPNDACQAAKHFPLTAFAQNRPIGASSDGLGRAAVDRRQGVHWIAPKPAAAKAESPAGAWRRAVRSLSRNWVALTA